MRLQHFQLSFQNHNLNGGERQSRVPYSGKLLREKTFANFAVLWLYAKVFSAKFGVWRPLALQKRAIRESFLHENCIFTNSRKFSPSKVSRYTVFCQRPEFTFHLIKTLSELSSFSQEKSSELNVFRNCANEGNFPQCFLSTSSDASHFRVRKGYLLLIISPSKNVVRVGYSQRRVVEGTGKGEKVERSEERRKTFPRW